MVLACRGQCFSLGWLLTTGLPGAQVKSNPAGLFLLSPALNPQACSGGAFNTFRKVTLQCNSTGDWLYLTRIYLQSLKYIKWVNGRIYYSLLTFNIKNFVFPRWKFVIIVYVQPDDLCMFIWVASFSIPFDRLQDIILDKGMEKLVCGLFLGLGFVSLFGGYVVGLVCLFSFWGCLVFCQCGQLGSSIVCL